MRRTSEFDHYHDDFRLKDPDNCGACALTDQRQDEPNYAAWPLAYMANNRAVPKKWVGAFVRQFSSSNQRYADNLRAHLSEHGVVFSHAPKQRYYKVEDIPVGDRDIPTGSETKE